MTDPTPSPEILLAQAGWVRALARRLLRDEGLAEDVAQETLMAGLGAREGRPAWLAGVARNLARRALRSRERLRRRELLARAGDPPPTPDEVLEREDARRAVVEALLRVREPFRGVLLLRYYEDLGPIDIARRLGVPAATVRSRLARGHALLRQALEEKSGHGHGPRALVLLAEPSGPGRALLSLGGSLMTATSIVLVSAGAVALLTTLFLAGRGERPAVPRTELARGAAAQSAEGARRPAAVGPGPAREGLVAAESAASEPAIGETWRLAIERGRGAIAGRVVRPGGAEPVAGVAVSASPAAGGLHDGFELEEDREQGPWSARTDEHGHFVFAELAGGPYRLRAEHGPLDADGFAVAHPEGDFVQLELRAPASPFGAGLRVQVVDSEGAPAPGTRVTLLASSTSERPAGEHTLSTDAAGEAWFEGIQADLGALLAEGPRGVARRDLWGMLRWAELVRLPDGAGGSREAVQLVLGPPGRIEGVVRGGPPGSVAQAWAPSAPALVLYPSVRLEQRAPTDEAGRFEFPVLAPGRYLMTVDAPPGWGLALPPADSGRPGVLAQIQVVVEPDRTARVELDLVPAPVLTGTVTDAKTGAPIAGARVRALLPQGMASDPDRVRRGGALLWRLDSRTSFAERHPLVAHEARTDARGEYRFDGLEPGSTWRVEVFAAGRGYERLEDVELAQGETRELEHVLVRAGGIQGVASAGECLGLRLAGAPDWAIAAIMPRTAVAPFTILGLAPGAWEIASLHSDPAVPPALLATLEVRAGELAWIDLRAAAPHRVQGQVVWRGAPVPGTVLDFIGPRVVTDADGRFEYAYPFATESSGRIDLTLPAEPDAVALRATVVGLRSSTRPWDGLLVLPEGRLGVQVLDAAGEPVEAELRLERVSNDPFLSGFEPEDEFPPIGEAGRVSFVATSSWRGLARATDVHGRAELEAMPGGRYLLRACAGTTVYPVRELELPEGEPVEVELRPGPGGRLEVLALDSRDRPLPSEPISIEQLGPASPLPLLLAADGEGRLEVEHLPVGRYRVSISARAFPERTGQTFDMHAGETARAELRRE